MDEFYIKYQTLVDLGFKRFDYADKVAFKEKGYDPFVMEFKLDKRFKLEINDERRFATLFRADTKPYEDNFNYALQLSTIHDLQLVFAVFGFQIEAIQLNREETAND